MNRELIQQMQSRFDALAKALPGENIEFWFARDLQEPLGYVRWENFLTAIKRAIESCETTGYSVSDHFRGITKMVPLGSGTEHEIDDAGFGRIRSKGDAVLFGGHTTQEMKDRFGITRSRPLADFLPTLTITAKNLASDEANEASSIADEASSVANEGISGRTKKHQSEADDSCAFASIRG